MALAADPVIDIGSSYNYYDAFTSVLMFGISIFGIYFCYKINSSGDNRDFILRLMCIGVPVLIRVIAVFIPIMIIGAILEITLFANGSGDEKVYESTPIKVALTSALVASYYWYLSRKIRAVSS